VSNAVLQTTGNWLDCGTMPSWKWKTFQGSRCGPQLDDAFPECDGLVEVRADELTPELMAAAIVHHGCLLVRGLLSRPTADALAVDIDRAFEGQETWVQDMEGTTGKQTLPASPWFEPFMCDSRYPVVNLDFGRVNRDYNRVLVADSPPTLFNLVEALDAAGVRKLVTGYLGQRPVLTVNKWQLRRMPRKRPLLGWHQEASVFSSRTRTVNFWIAFSECGDDAAGIEVLPHRVDRIVATPEKQYGLSDATVDSLDIGEPVAPVFAPGDALVFDDLLLHRTHMSDRVTKARYSTETWFFAPSHAPLDQGPIVF
jgi:Phytanoyl-CoA dioxygenase (PhyH)